MTNQGTIVTKRDPKKLHRALSAAAMFQKGIYHLFFLNNQVDLDEFVHTLRIYQTLFQIGVSVILLDFDGTPLDSKDVAPHRRVQAENDPGTAIEHGKVKKGPKFNSKHPLFNISQKIKHVYGKVDDARHEIIYRPYFKHEPDGSWKWEDCTFENLVSNFPAIEEIESVYKEFFKAMSGWNDKDGYAYNFITSLHQPLSNPPLTLLLNYARILNPSLTLNLDLMDSIRKYRNQLLEVVIPEKYLDNLIDK